MFFAQAIRANLDLVLISILAAFFLFLLVIFSVAFGTLRLWLQCFLSGGQVSLFQLIMMKFRRVKVKAIVECRIMSVQAGHPIPVAQLESAYLSGADVAMATRGYIDAKTSGKDFTFEELVDAERSDTLAKLLNK